MADIAIATPRTRTTFKAFVNGKKFRQALSVTICTLLIAIGSIAVMIPVVWMISTSLKAGGSLISVPPQWIPQEAGHVTVNGQDYFLYDVKLQDGTTKLLAAVKLNPTKSEFIDPANPSQTYYAPATDISQHFVNVIHWENYASVWNYATIPFYNLMKNTLLYAFIAVFAEVLINSFVAYGFARLRAPGKNVLFIFVLATMMLPSAVTMVPAFVLFTRYIPDGINAVLGTNVVFADTWWPLYIPKFFGSAYLIFLIRQFYMSIPKDYDEAARIDGAGYFQIWWRIIVPMSRPVLTAVAVLSFMYHWNNYMDPLIYLNSTDKLPLSVGLANFQVAYGGTPYHLMMAGSLIAVAPLILIFFFLNRYFVQGIVVSGIKG